MAYNFQDIVKKQNERFLSVLGNHPEIQGRANLLLENPPSYLRANTTLPGRIGDDSKWYLTTRFNPQTEDPSLRSLPIIYGSITTLANISDNELAWFGCHEAVHLDHNEFGFGRLNPTSIAALIEDGSLSAGIRDLVSDIEAYSVQNAIADEFDVSIRLKQEARGNYQVCCRVAREHLSHPRRTEFEKDFINLVLEGAANLEEHQ